MNTRQTVTRNPRHGGARERATADRMPEPEALWDEQERWSMIAENAYYRAERRGFLPGYEIEDWLAAEAEIDGPACRAAAA
jgi:hypothetical protein